MAEEAEDIQSVLASARSGQWRPVHVLVGSEAFLVDRLTRLLKKATVGDGPRGFNDDVFHGQGISMKRVVGAARTLPMMAGARFVLVRDLDDAPAAELDVLAEYVAAPSPTTCLVVTAEKIDGRSKLAKAAKASGSWVTVEPLKGPLLERFALGEVKRRKHTIDGRAAGALLDAVGNDLAALEDAVERLTLYVGGGPIDVAAVEAVVARVRVESVWALVDAVALRRTKVAIEAAGSLLANREPPLKILSLLTRQLRMIARFKAAIAAGANPTKATQAAGALPFKTRDLETSARKFSDADLVRAFAILADADVALKGSKRDEDIVLEETVLALARA